MILELFTILMIISLILIALGYFIEIDILKILGFFFIFVVAIALMNGDGIQYKSGDKIVTTGETSLVTHQYTNYDNWWINVFLMIVGVMSMTLVLVGRRTSSIRND